MPRWAYLAWQAIYNMVSIHIEIVVSAIIDYFDHRATLTLN